MDGQSLISSSFNHIWILDLDGTILNGVQPSGKYQIRPDQKEFFEKLPQGDMVIIITSHSDKRKDQIESLLKQNGVRCDHIIFNAPIGDRILINDL